MEAMQQMNIRIPADLKRAGDAELARLGYTPSQAIRRFYEFVIRNIGDTDPVNAVLDDTYITKEQEAERARKRAVIDVFWTNMNAYRKKYGLDQMKNVQEYYEKSDRELYIEAIMDRMRERGLLE